MINSGTIRILAYVMNYQSTIHIPDKISDDHSLESFPIKLEISILELIDLGRKTQEGTGLC